MEFTNENLMIIAYSLDFIAKLLIVISAILVHVKVIKEHKLDDEVFKQIHKEYYYVIVGILMLFISYLIKITTV